MNQQIQSLCFSSCQLISSSMEELYSRSTFTDRLSLLGYPCTDKVYYCLKSILDKKLIEKYSYTAFDYFNITLTSPSIHQNIGHNTIFSGCVFSFVLNEHNEILKNSNEDFVLIHRKSAAESTIIIVIINDT
jgi:hypothetical protein